jgi:hypothetical protein
VIETLIDSSGKRRVVVVDREDGTFTFIEERFSDEALEQTWIPRGRRRSASAPICASAEVALREARSRVEWLRPQSATASEPGSSGTRDRTGKPVAIGTRVRVIGMDASVLARLAADEAQRVGSMQGEVFEVYEIDAWGAAWVRKWWDAGEGRTVSHSLALKPEEIEVV